ncbi:MAG: hypothetical protein HUU55_05030 [Myxococcales bacterium]|nr:hypothetical protein [Myxococcales bacterium]
MWVNHQTGGLVRKNTLTRSKDTIVDDPEHRDAVRNNMGGPLLGTLQHSLVTAIIAGADGILAVAFVGLWADLMLPAEFLVTTKVVIVFAGMIAVSFGWLIGGARASYQIEQLKILEKIGPDTRETATTQRQALRRTVSVLTWVTGSAYVIWLGATALIIPSLPIVYENVQSMWRPMGIGLVMGAIIGLLMTWVTHRRLYLAADVLWICATRLVSPRPEPLWPKTNGPSTWQRFAQPPLVLWAFALVTVGTALSASKVPTGGIVALTMALSVNLIVDRRFWFSYADRDLVARLLAPFHRRGAGAPSLLGGVRGWLADLTEGLLTETTVVSVGAGVIHRDQHWQQSILISMRDNMALIRDNVRQGSLQPEGPAIIQLETVVSQAQENIRFMIRAREQVYSNMVVVQGALARSQGYESISGNEVATWVQKIVGKFRTPLDSVEMNLEAVQTARLIVHRGGFELALMELIQNAFYFSEQNEKRRLIQGNAMPDTSAAQVRISARLTDSREVCILVANPVDRDWTQLAVGEDKEGFVGDLTWKSELAMPVMWRNRIVGLGMGWFFVAAAAVAHRGRVYARTQSNTEGFDFVAELFIPYTAK